MDYLIEERMKEFEKLMIDAFHHMIVFGKVTIQLDSDCNPKIVPNEKSND